MVGSVSCETLASCSADWVEPERWWRTEGERVMEHIPNTLPVEEYPS